MPVERQRGRPRGFFRRSAEQIEKSLLRGAGRAGAEVLATEARDTVTSDAVRADIITKVSGKDGHVVAKVTVKPGWGYSVGTWLEWGTAPHYISVDPTQRGGRSARRINKLERDAKRPGTLVINGKPVGQTVFHPGADPHPFLRPALDRKGRDAVKAAQGYIRAHVRPGGIVPETDATA